MDNRGVFGFCACSGFHCSGFSVRATLATIHDSEVLKLVLELHSSCSVVRENLWKKCGKTWGKVGGKSCEKNVEKLGKASYSHKYGLTYTFLAGLWESFAPGFAHDFTEIGRGFTHFPQSLLLLLLNI